MGRLWLELDHFSCKFNGHFDSTIRCGEISGKIGIYLKLSYLKGSVSLYIISFLYPAIAIILLWLLSKMIYITSIKKRFDWRREVVNILYFCSLMLIIGFTIFPIFVVTNPEDYPELFVRNNYIPLLSIYHLLDSDYYMVPLRNIVGNILLFVPLGFILTLRFRQIKSMLSVGLIGLFLSLLIEVIQLNLPTRAFDIDDMILNTLGTILGFLICKITRVEYLFTSNSQEQLN